jgi:hypothetical protein
MRWATTTDHKVTGGLRMTTAFSSFLLGGVLALLMRAELARPGMRLSSTEQYNQLFTTHGTVMMLLFAITVLSAVVWAHHMFATGAVPLPFFSLTSFLTTVPTGVKFFNWIGTMSKGSLPFEPPMLWSLGFRTTCLLCAAVALRLAPLVRGAVRRRAERIRRGHGDHRGAGAALALLGAQGGRVAPGRLGARLELLQTGGQHLGHRQPVGVGALVGEQFLDLLDGQ